MPSKVALRYRKFAQEYVIDLNATRAAKAAGYSQSTASSKALQLLRIGKVRKLIDEFNTQRASRTGVTADRVVEELARLAFSNMQDFVSVDEDGKPQGIDMSKLSRDQFAAVQEIREDTTGGAGDGERRLILRTTLKLADKTKNLELLGRHLKMFTDKVEHSADSSLADIISGFRQRLKDADANPAA